ncbi:hypothetical protein [Pusillibacter faecalis]|uniref:Uncharacterized protein n=1 Tax=Pusillibacter faecalis TaxID=2714358 RepID=A0A830QTT9_9FIRM|nr:hypothetical protein [Pusillibacter faecalis]MCQ5025558.1 hypothetical protein [Oscillibacter valericigenes]BCK85869.1 hypothetical protein MM59RIKEN_31880 [Pusillibacter faecalis]
MSFRNLFELNEAWSSDDELLIVKGADRSFLRARTAVSLYGDHKVAWFYDDVVAVL